MKRDEQKQYCVPDGIRRTSEFEPKPMSRNLALLVALVTLPLSAHAYFDPGAGAVLLQLLIAAGIGAAYKFRHWLTSLLQAIKRLFGQ
jgi:hypothetical protein